MHRATLPLLTCILFFAGNLTAQETSSEVIGDAPPVPEAIEAVQETVEEAAQDAAEGAVFDSPSDIADAPSGSSDSAEEVASDVLEDLREDVEALQEDAEADDVEAGESVEDDLVKTIDAEANEVSDDEDAEDEEDSDGEEDLEDDAPLFVSVNEEGELIGLVTASVSGNFVPVEANVSLVSEDGVLQSKIVADEDGSFAFQDVAPGEYNLYGSASSYCGQQAFTVLPTESCTICEESVGLELTQGGGCYRGLSGAPATSFSSVETGGFFSSSASSVGGGGGGFVGGGGGAAAASRTGLRLLGIGGIITAIAVDGDDDDDASPSE